MGASKGQGWQVVLLGAVVLILAGCQRTPLPGDIAAAASETPPQAATTAPAPTRTFTASLSLGLTPTASGTPGAALAPTVRQTVSYTPTLTRTPSRTPTATPTPGPTRTRTGTPTASLTHTGTTTPTASPTLTPARAPAAGPTETPTRTPTITPGRRRTPTPTASRTLTQAPTATYTPTATPSSTPTHGPCPQATSELLVVEPVQSPTNELSQRVIVRMGNMEMVTITAESGLFTSPNGQVDVQLLPNTTHHLSVEARVRKVTGYGGCEYGGYSLHTTVDRNGARLIIVQGQPGPPPIPAEVIGPQNANRLAELVSFTPGARLVTDFSFLGAGTLLSVGYAPGGRITGWSLTTGQKVLEIGDDSSEALAVTASPDQTLIATGGTAADPAVRVWDVETGEMRELGRRAYLRSVAFSPSGALLASGDNDNVVQVWNVGSGEPVATFTGDVPNRSQSFGSLYWPDDQTLIAGGSYAIYTWDVPSGQMVRWVPAPEGATFLVDAAFAGGGTRIAAVAQDDRLYVWDGQWAEWPVPEGGAWLAFVAFNPAENLVAAETWDGVLYVWDAASGSLLATRWPAGPGGAAALRFSPDGRYLATGGWEAPIRVWGVP